MATATADAGAMSPTEKLVAEDPDAIKYKKSWGVDKSIEYLEEWPEKTAGYKELSFFLFFFALYILIQVWQINPTTSYSVNSGLRVLVDGYADVQTHDQFWEFLDGLLQQIFVGEWYSGQAFTTDQLGYIFYYHKLVGGVLVIQHRGASEMCDDGLYRIFYGECHSSRQDDKTPFGAKGEYTYNDGLEAFSMFFSVSKTRAQVVTDVQNYKDGLWLDKNTRQINVKFATYNGEYELFSFVVLDFRFEQGGVFAASHATIQSAKMEVYKTTQDYIRLGLEFLFVYLVAWIVTDELTDFALTVKEGGLGAYFNSIWNYLDMANIALMIMYVAFRAIYLIYVFKHPIKLPSNKYQEELEVVASKQEVLLLINILNIFVKVLHLFKHFEFQGRMAIINMTMAGAFSDLGHFFLLFFLIFLSYASMCLILFGPHLQHYRSIGDCIQTLGEMILGNFEYAEMHDISPLMSAILFWTYFLLVFFVLVNVFLAILIDAYAEAKSSTAGAQGIPDELIAWLRRVRAGDKPKTIHGTVATAADPIFSSLSFFQSRGIERITEDDVNWYMSNQLQIDPSFLPKHLACMAGLPDCEEAEEEPEVTINGLLKSAWATYDVDNSGYLDPVEFAAFIADAPVKLNVDDISELMRQTDTNSDGQISFDEFTPVFHAVMLNSLKTQAKELHETKKTTLGKPAAAQQPLAAVGAGVAAQPLAAAGIALPQQPQQGGFAPQQPQQGGFAPQPPQQGGFAMPADAVPTGSWPSQPPTQNAWQHL